MITRGHVPFMDGLLFLRTEHMMRTCLQRSTTSSEGDLEDLWAKADFKTPYLEDALQPIRLRYLYWLLVCQMGES